MDHWPWMPELRDFFLSLMCEETGTIFPLRSVMKDAAGYSCFLSRVVTWVRWKICTLNAFPRMSFATLAILMLRLSRKSSFLSKMYWDKIVVISLYSKTLLVGSTPGT